MNSEVAAEVPQAVPLADAHRSSALRSIAPRGVVDAVAGIVFN